MNIVLHNQKLTCALFIYIALKLSHTNKCGETSLSRFLIRKSRFSPQLFKENYFTSGNDNKCHRRRNNFITFFVS